MLYNFKNKIKLIYIKLIWRKKNSHNYTNLNSFCNIDKVKVGRFTYGNLSIYTSGCVGEGLKIGDFCSIASSTKFLLAGEHDLHKFMTYPLKQKVLFSDKDTISKGKIVLDDDVWVGENALITSGVHIGQGAVVAAGAVVVSDVPPYAIVGGVPAKVIKYRFEPEIVEKMLNIDFKKLSKHDINKYIDNLYETPTLRSDFGWLPKKK